MISRITVLLVAGLVMSSLPVAFAQDKPTSGTAENRGGARGGRSMLYKTALELPGITEDQKAKIEALQKKTEEARKAAAEGGERPDREKMREQLKQRREELEAILTPEQKAKFEEASKAWSGRSRDGQTSGHRERRKKDDQ